MKKHLSAILVLILLVSALTCFASADESSDLPFTLVAPGNVAVAWLEERDSPTTMRFTLSLTNEMTTFWSKWNA